MNNQIQIDLRKLVEADKRAKETIEKTTDTFVWYFALPVAWGMFACSIIYSLIAEK